MSLIWDRCFHQTKAGEARRLAGSLYPEAKHWDGFSLQERKRIRKGEERRMGRPQASFPAGTIWKLRTPGFLQALLPRYLESLGHMPVGKTLATDQSSLPAAPARAWGAGRLLVLFCWKTEPLFFLQILLQANCPPHGERRGPLQPLCRGWASTPVLLPPPPHLPPAPCPWGPSSTFWIIRRLFSPRSVVRLVVPPQNRAQHIRCWRNIAERENLENG